MKKAARNLVVGDKTSTFEVIHVWQSEPFTRCNVKTNSGGTENRRFHNSPHNLLNVTPAEV
jgi:hypothetical protein